MNIVVFIFYHRIPISRPLCSPRILAQPCALSSLCTVLLSFARGSLFSLVILANISDSRASGSRDTETLPLWTVHSHPLDRTRSLSPHHARTMRDEYAFQASGFLSLAT